ncbi:MAG: glutamine--fructose-6-phosphate transaminase (isomerizing) [Alphaproteobacteria bacterium]
MCGIVGILGVVPAAPRIVEALARLEYRGYDSAGIAVLENGALVRHRAPGKLKNLIAKLDQSPLHGNNGIGHTRWASHGAPNEANAHPQATQKVAVVHNGIIENFRVLREELEADGAQFSSDTDTEVVAQIIHRELARGSDPVAAVATMLSRVEGAFALAIVFAGNEDLMIGARRGGPLAVGFGENEMYLGSDAFALAPMTSKLIYLEDGDWAILSHHSCEIRDAAGQVVARPVSLASVSMATVDKGNHRHFMIKEIFEQPDVVAHTLSHYTDLTQNRVAMPDLGIDFAKLDRITIVACGTAYYAGLVAKYWFEQIARLPVDVDVASEFRYREVPLAPGGLAIFISQSGETADTLAALRYCKEQGQTIACVLNVTESSMGRESDIILPIFAGSEIGVASTKAFTCMLTALAALSVHAGKMRGAIDDAKEGELIAALGEVPRQMYQAIEAGKHIENIAKDLSSARDVLYLGRGSSFPIAMEGALKLKEISYIHAEGYAAGELKHGPIALIDETVPVVVVAPSDALYEKTVSNMQEVVARGGRIILIAEKPRIDEWAGTIEHAIELVKTHSFVSPIVAAVPVQLLAYHTGVHMGTDVDQPRNLAKSVTIE